MPDETDQTGEAGAPLAAPIVLEQVQVKDVNVHFYREIGPTTRFQRLQNACGAPISGLKRLARPAVIFIGHSIGATMMFAALFLVSIAFGKGLEWGEEVFRVPEFARFMFTWLERAGFVLDCFLYAIYMWYAARGFWREMSKLFKEPK